MNSFFKKSQILICKVLLVGAFIVLVQNCSIEEDNLTSIDYSEYLSLSKSGFDFASGNWDYLSGSDKIILKQAQERMDFTFDGDGIGTTKWTSNHQVNMSEELFNYFIDMIAFSNEVTNQLYEMQEIKTPRLKAGNESSNGCNPSEYYSRINNCVVQSLGHVTNYSYTTIDNWICSHGYYVYSSTNGWGVVVNPVLTNFSGTSCPVTDGQLKSATASKCILILSGSINHAVVFKSYNSSTSVVTYNDYQTGGTEHTCSINSILSIYKF
jgi:hypothetical protein